MLPPRLNSKYLRTVDNSNINKGKSITTDSIAELCEALNCQWGNLMEYVPDHSQDDMEQYTFSDSIKAGIYDDFSIDFSRLNI
ncbi:helix-turn-helix domain-containing protein [Lactonifactor sp. BIOML-A3]|uniref:helix-turn-helix domain-containing protein n=1 Tax=Lactonifactor longoviformis TaxID=341220 RepID=UPI0012AF197A|nr:helix-turn-helix domain-containing protein [Lactonifactor sp. BIOML-A5]MSA09636.1 helix-turn-helix domain-containing protein [Lactonifactor sp. BIOML-A4]MSA14178.1 helix-turn-helix domain-containing protein [Lactonifactor sp. BIOML-A3]MSA18641.1 helix-turn-helix domain-containing protein [Lactonifactor sp. BIOML-A2]MSA39423.1 helix-turn-helix domain-containing protein [Lactonifactor sp. BIOML-A1]MSB15210.1 helix-turn-helix domain-containing protein [Lactonifactor sp. BIOML-A6]MSB70749.1 he